MNYDSFNIDGIIDENFSNYHQFSYYPNENENTMIMNSLIQREDSSQKPQLVPFEELNSNNNPVPVPVSNQIEPFTSSVTITIPEISEQCLIYMLFIILIVLCTLTYNTIQKTNKTIQELLEFLKNNNRS